RELEITRSRIDEEQKRLLSAKERFGQMSPVEQQRLIQLKQRAERGEDIGVEGFRALDALGTRRERDLASGFFQRRAEAAGFDVMFGSGERRRIDSLQSE